MNWKRLKNNQETLNRIGVFDEANYDEYRIW
jgi:hypothetical protein